MNPRDAPNGCSTSGPENIPNRELLIHISTHHDAITSAFAEADFVELGNNALTLHPRRI